MNGENRDAFVALVNVRQALEVRRRTAERRIALETALYARRMKRERLCRIVIQILAALVCTAGGGLITLALMVILATLGA